MVVVGSAPRFRSGIVTRTIMLIIGISGGSLSEFALLIGALGERTLE